MKRRKFLVSLLAAPMALKAMASIRPPASPRKTYEYGGKNYTVMSYRGQWSRSVEYREGDVVRGSDGIYVCTVARPVSMDGWELITVGGAR